jgi:hypothetical protein
MPFRQINVRLDVDDHDVLEAAGFLRRTSVGELVRPSVERLIGDLKRDPAVRAALLAREEHQATQEGKLSRIDPKRRAAGDSDG